MILGADLATEVDTESQSTIYGGHSKLRLCCGWHQFLSWSFQTLGEGPVLIRLLPVATPSFFTHVEE